MTVTDLVFALAWPPAFALLAAPAARPFLRGSSWAEAAGRAWVSAGVSVVYAFTSGPWPCAAIGAAQVAFGVWLWRRGGRGRRRAPRAYGAKSRALVAAVVAKARDAATPRPVLRPVPVSGRTPVHRNTEREASASRQEP